MCSYHFSCIVFLLGVDGFQVEGCLQNLHHIFQVDYEILNGIDFDGEGRKICLNCVENIWVGWGGQKF